MKRSSSRARLALSVLALLSACTSAPGTFSVQFEWSGTPPSFPNPVYVFARVEERDVSPSTPGPILQIVGPVQYQGKPVPISFNQVENGDNRVVIVEMHETSSSNSQVLYYGISQAFDIHAGDHKVVPILFQIQSTPGAGTDGGPGATSTSISVVAPVTPGYVSTAKVNLLILASNETSVKLANQAQGVEAATPQALSGLMAAPGVTGGVLLPGWDLTAGLPAQSDCVLANAIAGCPMTVFAAFVDANGYESPVVSATVVLDQVPPSLTSQSVSPLLPTAAPEGSTVKIALVPDESLSALTVDTLSALDGGTGTIALTLGVDDTFTYPVDAMSPNGEFQATFKLTDLAGNSASSAPPAGFRIDTLAPKITPTTPPTDAPVYSEEPGHTTVTLTFDVAKDVDSTTNPGSSLTATLAGNAMSCGSFQQTSPSYTCTYVIQTMMVGGVPQPTMDVTGPQAIAVRTLDEAGNADSYSTSVTFDFVPLVINSTIAPNPARANVTPVLSVTANKAIAVPTVTPTAGAMTVGTLGVPSATPPSGTSTSWTFTYPATSGSDGTFTLATTAVDSVGHPGSTSTVFTVDAIIPTISNQVATPPRLSDVPGFNLVTLTFNTAESLSVPMASITATIGTAAQTWPMICLPYQAQAPNYTCTYTVTGGETTGPQVIAINAIDAAGNVASASTSVTFDFTALTMQLAMSPNPARLGAIPVLALTASKPLLSTNPPTVVVSQGLTPTTALGPVTTSGSGNSWTFTYPAAAPPFSGQFTATATASDDVGHMATASTPTAFVIDAQLPTITNVQTLNGQGNTASRFSAVSPYNALVVTFDWSSWTSAPPASVTATLGMMTPLTCSAQMPWAMPYEVTCLYTVLGSEMGTAQPITIQATDTAGNQATAGATVTLDFVAPTLTSQNATPLIAGVGQSELLTVTASESLGPSPVLTPSGPGPLSFTASASGTTYTFTAEIPSADPSNQYSGAYTSEVQLTDLVGNTQTVTGPAFQVDTVVPTISTVATNKTLFSGVAGFNQLSLTFNTPKSLDGPGDSVSATVGGIPLACGAYQTPPPSSYTCTYTVKGTEGDGPKPIVILTGDEAGNTESDASQTVTFDFTAPSLISGTPSPAKVGLTETEVLSLVASEALSAAPGVAVTGPGGQPAFTLVPNTTYNFKTVMQLAAPSAAGTYASAITLTDLVGNTATVPGPSFAYDPVIPAISNVQTSSALFSAIAPFNLVGLTFDLAKQLAAAPPSLTVTIGGNPMTCSYQTQEQDYSCYYTVTGSETEGPQTIVISTLDASGNKATANTTVTFDFTAPSLLTTPSAPSLFGLGQTISLTLQRSETLASGYPSIQVSGGSLLFAQSGVTFTHAVTSADAAGPFSVQWVLQDVVGNTSAALPSPAVTFSLDPVAPTVSITAGQGATYSRNAGFNQASISATTSEATAAVTATIGGTAMTCTQAALTTSWTCTYPVGASDQPGLKVVNVTATAPSGNFGTASTSVTFDFTPPTLVNTLTAPAIVGIGQTISFTLQPSKTLAAGSPAISVSPSGLTFDQTDLTFTHVVTSTDTGGAYTVQWTLVDPVGNSSGLLPTPAVSFTVDTTIPTVTITSGQGSTYSRNPGFNLVAVSATTSEASAVVSGTLGSSAMDCSASAVATSWTCTYSLQASDVAGPQVVGLIATAPSGNSSGTSTSVTFDFTPPTLLNTLTGPAKPVGLGQTISFTLQPSKALAAGYPQLSVSGGSLAFTTSNNGLTYSHVVTTSDSTGPFAVQWTLQDTVGNTSGLLPSPAVTFSIDPLNPTVTITSGGGATYSRNSGYSTVSIAGATSEAAAVVTATISGTAMTCTAGSPATNWSCTYSVAASDTAGAKIINVSATAPSGNLGTASTSVTFDFTSPTLVNTFTTPAHAYGIGQTISFTLQPSKTLAAGSPTINVSGGTLSFAQSGLTFSHLVSSSDGAGPYSVTWTLTDPVGNSSTLPSPATTFSIDPVLPTVTVISGAGATYSHNAGFKTVSIGATTSEASAIVTATVAGSAMGCTQGSPATNWTCTYTVQATDTAGSKIVNLTATAPSGNIGSATSTVTFDFTAPTLANVFTTPAHPYGLGQTIAFTLQPSKSLAAPTPTINVSGGSLAFVQSGLTFSHVVTSADGTGPYSIAWTLTDAVGNTSTLPSPATTFSIDPVPVTVAVTSAAGQTYSRSIGFSTVGVAVTATGTSPVVTATLGSTSLTCTQGSPATSWTCTYPVGVTDTAGSKVINIVATAPSGNTASTSTTVTFDFTAPTLANVFTTPANPYGLGQTISFTLQPSKPLGAGTPTINVSGGSLAFVQSGLTFSHLVTAADASGPFSVTWALTDLVGNTSTLPSPGTTFSIDPVPVTVAVSSGAGATYSRQPTFNTVSVGLTTTGTSPVVAATLGATSLTCAQGTPATNWTCTYPVGLSDTAGSKVINITATAPSGNTAGTSTTVTFDFTAPTLSNTFATPAEPYGIGQTITFTLQPSKTLAAPTPTIHVAGGSLTFAQSGLVFSHVVTSADGAGPYTVTWTLTDAVGNSATLPVPGATFSIDPVPAAVSITSGAGGTYSRQPTFDTVTIGVTTAGTAPLVTATIGGTAMTCLQGSPTTTWSCTYGVGLSDTQGSKVVTVTATAASGNSASASTTVTFDFTAPTLSNTFTTPAHAYGIGQTISYTLAPSETLATGSPVMNVSPSLAFAQGGLTFSHVVTASDAAGPFSVSWSLTDIVGNATTLPSPATTFSIDPVPVTVAVTSGAGLTYSRIAAHNTVSVGVTTSGTSPMVTATLGGTGLTCTQGTPATSWTCTYPVGLSDTAGSKVISIVATAPSGNAATASTTVTFDFTAPTLNNTFTTPANPYGIGQTISYTLQPSKTLGSGTPTINVSPATLTFAQSGLTFSHIVAAGDPAGPFTVNWTLTDTVGNTSTLPSPGTTFSIDSSLPTISVASGAGATYSHNTGFTLVTIGLNASSTTASVGVTATLAGTAMSCLAGTSPAWTCTYTVQPGDTAGSKVISLTAAAPSGNAATTTTAVTFDFTAPSLNNALTASANPYGIGQTISFTLIPSKTLAAGYPTINVSGGSLAFSQSGLTFSHVVTAADAVGPYSVSWNLKDAVGNGSTLPSPGVTFSIDNALPTIAITSGAGTSYSHTAGSTLVSVGVNASSTTASVVVTGTLSGSPMTCTAGTSPAWTCTYTVLAGDTAGSKVVTLTATAPSGNAATASTAVTFDFTAPTLTNSFPAPTAPYGIGQTISFALTPSKPLASGYPTINVSGGSLTFSQSGLTFYHVVTAADAVGPYAVTWNLKDAAGNTAVLPAGGASFSIDNTLPTISVTSGAGTTYSHNPGFTAVSIGVNASSTTASVTVTGTLGGTAMGCTAGTSPAWTCTYTVLAGDTAGSKVIALTATAPSGNAATVNTTVTFNFTAPSLLTNPTSLATPVGLGQTISFALQPSEAMAVGYPQITVTPSVNAPTFAQTGNTFTHTVSAADTSGTYSVQWTLKDSVGNTSPLLPATPVTFTVDTYTPTVTINSPATGTSYSYNMGHSTVTITATTTVNTGIGGTATVTGTIGTTGLTCLQGSPATSWTCTYSVTGMEPPGSQVVILTAKAPSGNAGTSSPTTVFFDFTPLTLTGSVSPSPSGATATPIFTLISNKSLTAAPTLTVAGLTGFTGGLTQTNSPGAGAVFSYDYTLNASTIGTFAFSTGTVTDSDGFTATLTPVDLVADNVPPAVASFTSPAANTTFSSVVGSGHNSVSVVFTSNKTLAAGCSDVVSALIGSASLGTCTFTSPNKFSYTYTVPTTGAVQGTNLVSIVLKDEALNQGGGAVPVVFDFTPPSLVGTPTLTYQPAPANPLVGIGGSVGAATVGTTVQVGFTLSEGIETGYPTVALASSPVLAFNQYSASGSAYVYQLTIPSSGRPADNSSPGYGLTIVATDLVGNQATLSPAAPDAKLITATPPNPDTVAGGPIQYTRIPWGNSTYPGTPTFVVAGTKVAVAPVTPSSTVLVYDGASDIVGHGTADSNGNFSIALSQADRANIYISVVDAAGNASAAASGLVHNVVWHATFGNKVAGSTLANPNVLEVVEDAYQPLAASPPGSTLYVGPLSQTSFYSAEASSYAGVVSPSDSVTVSATAVPSEWIEISQASVAPGTTLPTMAYDSARGRVVLFGEQMFPTTQSVTWEWNGTQWEELYPYPSVPAVRTGQAMVYDAASGVTLLFGGSNSGTTYQDTWTWNGTTWTLVASGGPPAGSGSAMAYDPALGAVILLSTSGQTWEWTGAGWTNLTATSGTAPTGGGTMTYDVKRQVIDYFVVVGGVGQTWTWNTTWTNTGAASPTLAGTLAYDSRRGVAVLCSPGVSTTTSAIREWNGSSWTTGSVVTESQATTLAAAYDSLRGQTIVIGGFVTQAGTEIGYNGVNGWDGSAWVNLSASASQPLNYDSAVVATALAYDPVLESSFVFDYNDAFWGWQGLGWEGYSTASGPAARYGTGLSFDTTRGRMVLFGGESDVTGYLTDTWEWDGSTWYPESPSTVPNGTNGLLQPLMVFDPVHNVTVLDGGNYFMCTGVAPHKMCHTYQNETTYTWNGSNWLQVATTGPSDTLCMVYDAAQGAVISLAGSTIWNWNGSAWASTTPSGGPTYCEGMAFDSTRGVSMVYDGTNTYEWNGLTNTFTEIDPPGPSPAPPSAMAYDAARARTLLFDVNAAVWESPSTYTVAQIAQMSFGEAGATSPTIEGMTFTAYAGGVGNNGGTWTNGVELAAWDAWSGAWKVLTSNGNGMWGPPLTPLTYTAAAAEASRYLIGQGQTINLAVMPTYGRGSGTNPTEMELDYVELTVNYQQ